MDALIDTADVETLIKCIELMEGADYYHYRHCLYQLMYITEIKGNCPPPVVKAVNDLIYRLGSINTAAQVCERLRIFTKEFGHETGQQSAG